LTDEELIVKIRENLSPDLLKKEYREINKTNPMYGHCYVASEVFYHLSENKYRSKILKVGDITHWFLVDNNKIIDITKDQFNFELDYNKSRNCAFLTKEPSLRAQKLINKIKQDI
jgi:hypothetical protein